MPEKSIAEQRTFLVKQAIELAPRTINKHPQRVNNEKPDHISIDESGGASPSMDIMTAAKMINGVHLDMYDFFDIPVSKVDNDTLERLQYLMSWAMAKEPTMNNALSRFQNLMVRLGNWSTGRTKVDTIYNWIRINGNA